jgi:hypothetical protein
MHDHTPSVPYNLSSTILYRLYLEQSLLYSCYWGLFPWGKAVHAACFTVVSGVSFREAKQSTQPVLQLLLGSLSVRQSNPRSLFYSCYWGLCRASLKFTTYFHLVLMFRMRGSIFLLVGIVFVACSLIKFSENLSFLCIIATVTDLVTYVGPNHNATYSHYVYNYKHMNAFSCIVFRRVFDYIGAVLHMNNDNITSARKLNRVLVVPFDVLFLILHDISKSCVRFHDYYLTYLFAFVICMHV